MGTRTNFPISTKPFERSLLDTSIVFLFDSVVYRRCYLTVEGNRLNSNRSSNIVCVPGFFLSLALRLLLSVSLEIGLVGED